MVGISQATGFWKIIGTALGFTFFRVPYYIISVLIQVIKFVVKSKISLYFIMAILIIFSSAVTSIQDKDPLFIVKDTFGRIVFADYGLKDELTVNPLIFPILDNLGWWGQFKAVVMFFWGHKSILGFLWFNFAVISLMYKLVSKRNTSEPYTNQGITLIIYTTFIVGGSALYFNDVIFPFNGLYELIKQIFFVIPSLPLDNLINTNQSLLNNTGGILENASNTTI